MHSDGSKESVESAEARRAKRRSDILQKIEESNLELFSPEPKPPAPEDVEDKPLPLPDMDSTEVEITSITGASLPMFYPANVGELTYRASCLGLSLKLSNYRTLQNRALQVSRNGCQFKAGKPTKTRLTRGDGNCFFRAVSNIFTGFEDQHVAVRQKICKFIKDPRNIDLLRGHLGNYQSGAAYVKAKSMDQERVWASDVEIVAAAAISRQDIAVYTERDQFGSRAGNWEWFRASGTPSKKTANAVYISNVDYHYQPVYDA